MRAARDNPVARVFAGPSGRSRWVLLARLVGVVIGGEEPGIGTLDVCGYLNLGLSRVPADDQRGQRRVLVDYEPGVIPVHYPPPQERQRYLRSNCRPSGVKAFMMCGPVHGIMKLDIKPGERFVGAAGTGGAHSLYHVKEAGEIFLGRRLAGTGYRQLLEGYPQRRELGDVYPRQVRDGSTLVPLARDEALLLKPDKRLSHRPPAHPQPLRDLGFTQPVAWLKLPGQDEVPELDGGLVRQAAALDGGPSDCLLLTAVLHNGKLQHVPFGDKPPVSMRLVNFLRR